MLHGSVRRTKPACRVDGRWSASPRTARCRWRITMAEIVLGIGKSHTPLLSLPPDLWETYAQNDRRNPELLAPPDATAMSYNELEAHVGGRYAAVATPER